MQRTIRVKLQPTAEQATALRGTVDLFTESFNEVCRIGWDAGERNSIRLHHLSYRKLKDRLPALVSDLHIQARVKAAEAIGSAVALIQKGRKVSCPQSKSCPPRYNLHTYKIDWESCVVKLSTTAGRLSLPFFVPNYYRPMLEGKVCTADLILSRRGTWWLHVVVETPTPEVPASNIAVGVDLGISRPAVTSDGSFLGDRRWREVESRIFRQKRQCQSKGTQSAKRRLRILRGKQARFRRDCDHVISRRIVDAVPAGGTIVMEDLTHIRERVKAHKQQRRRLHGWSFAQLKSFVGYKAEAKGCRVESVDPRYTSQTCCTCGFKHRSNRKSQSLFKCRQCGFTINADLNGSRNIRARFLGIFGKPVDARPSSTGPTNAYAFNAGESSTCKPSALADGR
jgi:IS605 OrfB family transposase